MRVLMLNYEFPPLGGGGGHAHACLLQEYGQMTDLEVDVVTSGVEAGVQKKTVASGVTIMRVGIDKDNLHVWKRQEVLQWLWRAGPLYRRLLRDQSYDLVHAFFAFPSGWLCYCSRRRLPYIVSLRGSDVPGANARLQLEYKLLGPCVFKPIWRQAAQLVACSHGLRERALRFLPNASIDVIPNGVHTDRFYPRESKKDLRTSIRLVTVGRLSVSKRVHLLIEAVAQLKQGGIHATLTVAGDGALHEELEASIEKAGVQTQVQLRGRCEADEMPAIYRDHDLYVSATVSEGMSNAMLEAMASGLPIITTSCEGVEELVQDNGKVLHDAEASSFAEAIQDLVGDSAEYQRMCRAARTRAETFSWASAAQQYHTLYTRLSGEQIR